MTTSRKVPGYDSRRMSLNVAVPPDTPDRAIVEGFRDLIERGLVDLEGSIFEGRKIEDFGVYVAAPRDEQPRNVKRKGVRESQEKAEILMVSGSTRRLTGQPNKP